MPARFNFTFTITCVGILICFQSCHCFLTFTLKKTLNARDLPLPLINNGFSAPSKSIQTRRISTALNLLDIFGLGAPELVVVMIAGAVLFGPDGVKKQLRQKGVESPVLTEGPIAERAKRIKEELEYAKRCKDARSWRRINAALDADDPNMLRKMSELEEMGMLENED